MRFSLLNWILAFSLTAVVIALFVESTKNRTLTIQLADTSATWNIDSEMLFAAPSWTNKRKPPPLPVGEALLIADEILNELNRDSEKFHARLFQIGSVGLVPLGGWPSSKSVGWCYVLEFQGTSSLTTFAGYVRAVVLMDKTVLFPDDGINNDVVITELRKVFPATKTDQAD